LSMRRSPSGINCGPRVSSANDRDFDFRNSVHEVIAVIGPHRQKCPRRKRLSP
jgi:hypothetical protein